MDLAERFAAAVTQVYAMVGADADLLPLVLARACVEVLPIAGAGLSITGELRIPLGASDERASRAERLQTTLGEGPCLATSTTGTPGVFDLAAMARTWPVFHGELVAQTPFRSIASFPLVSPHGHRFGALDLYSTDPDGHAFRHLVELGTTVVDPLAVFLFDTPARSIAYGIAVPPWATNDFVTRRLNVDRDRHHVQHPHLSSTNALDVLRAYAFGPHTALDDTADLLTTQRLRPSAVLAS